MKVLSCFPWKEDGDGDDSSTTEMTIAYKKKTIKSCILSVLHVMFCY